MPTCACMRACLWRRSSILTRKPAMHACKTSMTAAVWVHTPPCMHACVLARRGWRRRVRETHAPLGPALSILSDLCLLQRFGVASWTACPKRRCFRHRKCLPLHGLSPLALAWLNIAEADLRLGSARGSRRKAFTHLRTAATCCVLLREKTPCRAAAAVSAAACGRSHAARLLACAAASACRAGTPCWRSSSSGGRPQQPAAAAGTEQPPPAESSSQAARWPSSSTQHQQGRRNRRSSRRRCQPRPQPALA